MKTVTMDRDYAVRVNHRQSVQYRAGHTYERVPEFQATAILAAGAGRVAGAERPADQMPADASSPRRRRTSTGEA